MTDEKRFQFWLSHPLSYFVVVSGNGERKLKFHAISTYSWDKNYTPENITKAIDEAMAEAA